MPQTAKKLESHVSSQCRVLWAHAISGSCEIDHRGSCGRYLRFKPQCATLRQRRGRSPLSPNGVGSATRFRPRSIFGTQRSESAFRRTLSLSSSMGIAARMGSKVDGTGGAACTSLLHPQVLPARLLWAQAVSPPRARVQGIGRLPRIVVRRRMVRPLWRTLPFATAMSWSRRDASRRSSDCV